MDKPREYRRNMNFTAEMLELIDTINKAMGGLPSSHTARIAYVELGNRVLGQEQTQKILTGGKP